MPLNIDPETASSKQAFLIKYQKSLRRIRTLWPGCKIMNSLIEMESAVKTHVWGRVDAAAALHCKVDLFAKRVQDSRIPCIYVNETVKERFAEHFKTLSPAAQRGQIFFEPSDIADWLHRNATATIETVLVPLTILSDYPEQFYRAFLQEKERRLPIMIKEHGVTRDYAGRLCRWDCCEQYLRPEFRGRIGRWYETLKHKALQQDAACVSRATLKAYEIPLPEGFIPKLYSLREFSQRMGFIASNTAGRRMARHMGAMELTFATRKNTSHFMAFGPLAGGGADAKCFPAGLLDLWTAEQYVEVFGEDALKHLRWKMPEGEVTWSEEDLSGGPRGSYLEMKALQALDYAPSGRPSSKA